MKLGKHIFILALAFGAVAVIPAYGSKKPNNIQSHKVVKTAGDNALQNKAAQNVAGNFELQKLAEGVYAVIRKDLPGLMVDANNVFIINDDDVIVVDANGAPAITKAVLAALRKLTD